MTLETIQPLRKWNPKEEVLTFIHIGKSSGTSFYSALLKNKVNGCPVKCVQSIAGLKAAKTRLACPHMKPVICLKHFDWTMVTEGEQNGYKMAPLILFREPVTRAVSHFYFRKTLQVSIGEKMRDQTLGEYLADTESMLETRQIWFDGAVCVSKKNF